MSSTHLVSEVNQQRPAENGRHHTPGIFIETWGSYLKSMRNPQPDVISKEVKLNKGPTQVKASEIPEPVAFFLGKKGDEEVTVEFKHETDLPTTGEFRGIAFTTDKRGVTIADTRRGVGTMITTHEYILQAIDGEDSRVVHLSDLVDKDGQTTHSNIEDGRYHGNEGLTKQYDTKSGIRVALPHPQPATYGVAEDSLIDLVK